MRHHIDQLKALQKYGPSGKETRGIYDVLVPSKESMEAYIAATKQPIAAFKDLEFISELQKVPELIIVSADAMREFHDQAALVADIIAYDVVGAFFAMARAGRDAMTILINMLTRIANQLASMWIWEKVYAWQNPFAGTTTSGGAIVGGGVSGWSAGGGIEQSITIIDQRAIGSPDIAVTQSGGDVRIVVTDLIKDSIATGALDDTLRNNFGLSRSVVVR